MAEPLKNITETLIIPDGSRERFILFREPGEPEPWYGNGLFLSGISELKRGYLVRRPACAAHFLGYITGGASWVDTESGRAELKSGTFVFLRADTCHQYGTNRPFTMIWFHLNPAHSRWKFLKDRANFHRPARCAGDIAAVMERAYAESHAPRPDGAGVGKALCRLALAYLDRELEHNLSDAEFAVRERLEKVWREVGRDLARPWDIRALARLAGMSASRFHAEALRHFGAPPMRIVRGFRVERARALLRATPHKLDAIAEQTGYESPFSFSRAFKEITGISPRAYRQGAR